MHSNSIRKNDENARLTIQPAMRLSFETLSYLEWMIVVVTMSAYDWTWGMKLYRKWRSSYITSVPCLWDLITQLQGKINCVVQ